MGAWIEISKALVETKKKGVAPLVGAWIEIGNPATDVSMDAVAHLVGAWIEIHLMYDML